MKYVARCLECNTTFPENKYVIKCPNGCNSLLRSEYSKKQITKQNLPGIWKYSDWLPVTKVDKNLLIGFSIG